MRNGSGIILLLLFFVSCSRQNKSELPVVQKVEIKPAFVKPASHSKDTAWITSKSAVFFQPDSLQLQQLRSTVTAGLLESTMHEYYYQMRNARNALKQQWKEINQQEISNTRWLAFEKSNAEITIIDLDKNNELCGIYLFNRQDDPLFIDMMNIETQAGFYFTTNKK